MKILLVNPNTTASMTDKIAACARQFADPGVEIVARNPGAGVASIEGHYDEVVSSPGLLAEIKRGEEEGFDGFVVACFDDPAVAACREIASAPVLGICESAMHTATMLANSFSVVTTLPRAVPIIEALARKYGMQHYCKRVRAANIPVLDLETDGDAARQKIKNEVLRARAEDNCESVILGCAGMADLAKWLSEESGVPVIDGVAAATRLICALAGGGFRTSKIGAFAAPRKK